MREQNYRQLIEGALTALTLLVLAPAAVADPGSPPASRNSGPMAVSSAQSVDPPSAPAASVPQPADETGSEAPAQPASSPAAGSSGGGTEPAPGTPSIAGQSAVPAPAPASSTSTTQTIWQVQNLGCSARCVGASQSQTAQQTNVTAGALRGTSAGEVGSEPATELVQLQLACIAHCFGSSTVASHAHGDPAALQELLGSPGPPELPNPDPAPTAQIIVRQSSSQLEEASGLVSSQSQVAAQVSDASSALADLAGLLGADPSSVSSDPSAPGVSDRVAASAPSPAAKAINQVEQAIWQLQIGCLVFCSQTNQSQQAEQSTTTVGVIAQTPGPGSPALPATASYQLVWQLQVGCLFWCYDTVETQTATIANAVVSVAAPNPPPGPGDSSEGVDTAPEPGGTPTSGTGSPGPAPAPTGATGSATGVAPTTLRGSPALGLIGAAPGTRVGAGITGPVRPRPMSAGRRTVRIAVLSVPSAPSAGQVTSLLPMVNFERARARTAPAGATSAGATSANRELRLGWALPRGHHAARNSEATARELLYRTAGSSWELIVFFVVLGLFATALEISGLRGRWKQRLNGGQGWRA